MDKMTDIKWSRYETIYSGRFPARKKLVGWEGWSEFLKYIRRVAPIDPLAGDQAPFNSLQAHNISISEEVRHIYAIRKNGKHIRNVDAFFHFRDIK